MTITKRTVAPTVVEDPEAREVVLHEDVDGDELQVGAEQRLVVPAVGARHQQATRAEDQTVVLTDGSQHKDRRE
jgi:hypothetical protein